MTNELDVELDENGEPIVDADTEIKHYAPLTKIELAWPNYNTELGLNYRRAKAERSPKELGTLSNFERCSLTGEAWVPRRRGRSF